MKTCSIVMAGLLFLSGLSSCGGDEGNNPECLEKYGLVVDGDPCNENGDSREECPRLTCSCPGVTLNYYICFDGTCVTAIGDCDAWCAASDSERRSCF